MIKRIKSIKNLSVFSNYRHEGDLLDFNEKNIIYGWNYTGKTTLSRLFSFLDKNNIIDDEFNAVEFEVELADNQLINKNNRSESPLSIKVFNSDFIRDNLRFESEDNKIKGITFDVGGGVEIRNKIKENEDIIKKGTLLRQRNTSNIEMFNAFDAKFTQEASRIKYDFFNSLIEFNKGHLKKVIDSLNNQIGTFAILSGERLVEIKANALAQNTKKEFNAQLPDIQFDSLYREVEDIMSSEPKFTDEDPILSKYPELYEWSKKGYDLYKEERSDVKQCAFCGNEISQSRLEYLNAFYSNEAAKLKERISELKIKINSEKEKVGNLEWSKMSPNDLIDSCQQDFKSLLDAFSDIKLKYISLLDQLLEHLEKKSSASLFVKTLLEIADFSAKTNLFDWILSANQIFIKHDSTVKNFDSIQGKAREDYKKYLVSVFLIRENYVEVKRLNEIEESLQRRCEIVLAKREEENKYLSAQLKSLTKGKEKLNDFIKLFLNRDDVLIDVTADDYFILKRGDKVAKNLSEGEKTAIAFSHFMVLLGSLFEDKKLQETIIFIDDPISSLDANHIAQISSMINAFFFRKGIDDLDPNKIVNCFKQLFISTHNFEFYSFLRDANNIKRSKKIVNPATGKSSDVPACNYFFIKRISGEKSLIQNLPKTLSKYNSEYIYLFSEIDRFKDDHFPEDRAYMMPNVVRRFLEIYTLIKLPGNVDQIDNRIKILVGDINELKILHNFSHFTSFERATRHTELIFKTEDIINDVYILLGKDEGHLSSLFEGIGKKMDA